MQLVRRYDVTMLAPDLDSLPPPPAGKTGWPWTDSGSLLAATMSDGSPWPRISVVTPSYNQADFLEETIRSVLLQGYPNLEYLVIDGGSTDHSIEIIRRYEKWLTYWASEPDRGQCHAINKGWARATGDFVAYLNSDDVYFSNAFSRAVAALMAHPQSAMVYSDGLWIDEANKPLWLLPSVPMDIRKLLIGTGFVIPQPTTLIRRSVIEELSGLDESLHMAMDLDLWLKIALHYPMTYLPGDPLAGLRWHASQKTQTRVLEDRLCSQVAFERALNDPRCPRNVTYAQSNAYRRLCLDLSNLFWQERKVGLAWDYLARALKTNLLDTLSQLVRRTMVHTYMRLPMSLRQQIRRWRGRELMSESVLRS